MTSTTSTTSGVPSNLNPLLVLPFFLQSFTNLTYTWWKRFEETQVQENEVFGILWSNTTLDEYYINIHNILIIL